MSHIKVTFTNSKVKDIVTCIDIKDYQGTPNFLKIGENYMITRFDGDAIYVTRGKAIQRAYPRRFALKESIKDNESYNIY